MYGPAAAAFTVLGDVGGIDEPGASASLIGEASEASYQAWAAAVRALGGKPVAYAYHGTLNPLAWSTLTGDHDSWGSPAARYPMSIASQFTQEPDQVASAGGSDVAYYLAPVYVTRWAKANDPIFGGLLSAQEMRDDGRDLTKPDDDPPYVKNIKTGLKIAALGLGAIVLMDVMSFLPRPRS